MDNRGETVPGDTRMLQVPGTTGPETSIGTGGAPTHLPYGLSLSSSMAVLRSERTLELLAIDHLAIRVADIRRAEAFYHELFQMDVELRARRVTGQWETMPNDFDWIAGLQTGYYPDLVAMRNGPLSLMLENAGRGAAIVEPRLNHVGLRVSRESLAILRATALVRSFTVTQDDPHAFRFTDPFGVSWHLIDEAGPSS